MKRFKEFFLAEAVPGVDVLDPEQDSMIGDEGEVTDPAADDAELVDMVLAAFRVDLDDTARHYFSGEDFNRLGPIGKLEVVKKMIDKNKPVTEAVGDDEEEEPDPEAGGEEPPAEPPEEGLPLGDVEEPTPEEPLEIEEVADVAVKALLEDPSILRHTLGNLPYHTTPENHREVWKIIKSRLYY